MSNYGALLISKVVDNNEVIALERNRVTDRHFTSKVDKKAYDFIRSYAKDNRGRAPSYAALVEAVPQFNYIPAVEDSYEYLCRRLFNESASDDLADFINGDVSAEELRKNPHATLTSMYEEYNGDMPTLLAKIQEKLQDIAMHTTIREKIGYNVKTDGERFKEDYRKRKSGESHKVWRSRYPAVNKYTSGNMYVVYGESGRGKSVTTLADVIYMASQGANCLVWGMEMPYFEILVRLYSILSADRGLETITIAGIDMSAGFNAGDIRDGALDDAAEAELFDFIDRLSEDLEGNIVIRSVDDDDFDERSVKALEVDIMETNADVVMIDPFYYMTYEKNSDKTTGGAASATSQALRKMTGRLKVVVIAITQAKEMGTTSDEDGNRELSLPDRDEVTKTASLMQDAYQLIAVDTCYKQGRGLIGINKGRDGGEGDISEIVYLPQFGVCRPLETGEASVEDFGVF